MMLRLDSVQNSLMTCPLAVLNKASYSGDLSRLRVSAKLL